VLYCSVSRTTFKRSFTGRCQIALSFLSMINGRRNETFTVLKDRVEKTTVSMHIHSYIIKQEVDFEGFLTNLKERLES
jgi:hypothetical protein